MHSKPVPVFLPRAKNRAGAELSLGVGSGGEFSQEKRAHGSSVLRMAILREPNQLVIGNSHSPRRTGSPIVVFDQRADCVFPPACIQRRRAEKIEHVVAGWVAAAEQPPAAVAREDARVRI